MKVFSCLSRENFYALVFGCAQGIRECEISSDCLIRRQRKIKLAKSLIAISSGFLYYFLSENQRSNTFARIFLERNSILLYYSEDTVTLYYFSELRIVSNAASISKYLCVCIF